MNEQRRQAAIEAGARALWAASLNRAVDDEVERAWAEGLAETAQRSLRAGAAAVIDAAAPHLAGEPVGYDFAVRDSCYPTAEDAARARDQISPGWTVVALMPLQGQQ